MTNVKEGIDQEKVEKSLGELTESEVFKELMNVLFSSKSLEDAADKLTWNISGGQIYELPAAGLDQVTLDSSLIQDQAIGEKEEPNDRKSRPKEP